MKRTGCLAVALLLTLPLGQAARANGWCHKDDLDRTNRQIHGYVVDYTHNHGADRRIWSPTLGEKRDLYVYLPPGFDPAKQYPLILWLHGFAQDEQAFLLYTVKPIDAAIAAGQLPPVIIAAPDGSLDGSPCLLNAGSFFINSNAGPFEDYLMQDVWDFVVGRFPIRPERGAHVLAGVSMGGGAAYNLAIKYRDRVGVVVGFLPPLNTRWVDCHGNYKANFDPACWGWRSAYHPLEPIARFKAVVVIRARRIAGPLYGRGPEVIASSSRENPIEMLDSYGVCPGELAMWVGYGGKDEFNVDAQVESFLYRAHERGLQVAVSYVPDGRHDLATSQRVFPDLLAWLGPLLAPYAP